MKNYLIFLLIFISAACADSPDEQIITRRQAIEDIDYMVNYIRETHPDMFAECPETVFMKKVNEVKANLPQKINKYEFYKYIGGIPPLLGDGHTNIWPEKGMIDSVDNKVFPYIVNINPADSSISIMETGKKVVSINTVPAKEICGTLIRYASGESLAYRLGSTVKNNFPVFMKLIYPAKRYTIVYEADGAESSEIAELIPLDSVIYKMDIINKGPFFTYSIRDDISTCILDFKQFTDYHNFIPFLKEMFIEIQEKNIKNLIIDLRSNGGGNSALGDELFQYISPVPFAQFGDVTIRYSDNVRNFYSKGKNNTDNFPQKDTIMHYKADTSKLIPLRDNPLRFAGKGNVYLLTSINTFSSAGAFSWTFQYFNMGKIIGEETGGHIVSFGDNIGHVMPNSLIRIGSSWKKFYGYGATDEHTHGTIPDYPVPADEALDFTINKLILNN